MRRGVLALAAVMSAQTVSGGARNVLGGALAPCCPGGGFFRDGRCATGPSDAGSHTVCALVTRAFLDYTRARGNDLETPRREYAFPGLKPGDAWCLCAGRWAEAAAAGVAPPVVLAATNAAALDTVPRALLLAHAHEPLAPETLAALLAEDGGVADADAPVAGRRG